MRGMDAEPADDRAAVEERYRHYLDRCNEHCFGELDAFVAPDVHVNGVRVGIHEYGAGLAGVVELFPDFRWTLEELVVEGDRIAARLTDTATSADGERRIRIQEFAQYRLAGGLIVEAWGDLDRWRLDAAPDAGESTKRAV